ncbi:MAG: polyketide cyclase / dehydrase and lipid transport [Mycobacteriaceae bacterium]
MSSIQVADQTFIVAQSKAIGGLVSPLLAPDGLAERNWRKWWPELVLTVREDRGEQGVRWLVSGPYTGTMELWLEPTLDGTCLHYFFHAEPTAIPPHKLAKLDLVAINRQARVAGKRMAFEVKATLELGRVPGDGTD